MVGVEGGMSAWRVKTRKTASLGLRAGVFNNEANSNCRDVGVKPPTPHASRTAHRARTAPTLKNEFGSPGGTAHRRPSPQSTVVDLDLLVGCATCTTVDWTICVLNIRLLLCTRACRPPCSWLYLYNYEFIRGSPGVSQWGGAHSPSPL